MSVYILLMYGIYLIKTRSQVQVKGKPYEQFKCNILILMKIGIDYCDVDVLVINKKKTKLSHNSIKSSKHSRGNFLTRLHPIG